VVSLAETLAGSAQLTRLGELDEEAQLAFVEDIEIIAGGMLLRRLEQQRKANHG
jgi:hypothetical protein